jgi:hypothetical protein
VVVPAVGGGGVVGCGGGVVVGDGVVVGGCCDGDGLGASVGGGVPTASSSQ